MRSYDFKTLEPGVLEFWKKQGIYEKLVKRNQGNKKFYYLDGPPYTTGKIHIGHAWGKALRDSIMRYKRMQEFDVWDRPGFDMHGLPIEVNVEKELGIKDKKEIINKVGLANFVEACQKYSLEQLWPMVEDFKRLGIWMNWDNPYMTIRNEYIEGAWWALAQAHKKNLLYLGKKAMTWCPRCATALAKHELEYANRSDDSIYVKFKLEGKDNEYLVIWTTTPWTIPFNLAVMVHPDVDYIKAKAGEEIWIVAEPLLAHIAKVAKKELTPTKTIKGKALEGQKYVHPFKEEVPFHQERKEKHAHAVLLSKEYVSTQDGTGLVHCAPGCGPEDFEVGKAHGLPAFNECDDHGCYSSEMGKLAGLVAKQEDNKFIELLNDKGLLVAKSKIKHEYAHCWRCKTPVIFRATDQWFLAVEKLRDQMVEENKSVNWVPNWAGNRWFDSWLKSLQDWCISRQRFWGIPLPIWVCTCGEHKVIATRAELKELSGHELENVHRPWIDEVKIKCSCGNDMVRTPDVLDVWLDSGVGPWATLNFPSDKEKFEEMGFPDLILEGKDQIRGWFNSLMCMSMVSFGKVPYKAVYMHGMINDSQGRKMSKSLKNFITPYEITEVYGADTLRYYQIGGAQPGLDLNFNHEDAKLKHRNLIVLWNVQNFLIDLCKEIKFNPLAAKEDFSKRHGIEEQFILSKTHSTIKRATALFDEYKINDVPIVVEELFLALSRDYIQMVRDKAAVGDDRDVVAHTICRVLTQALKLFAPIAPFITEKLWQNLHEEFGQAEESVHLCEWPKADESQIDEELEQKMRIVSQIVQSTLAAREKAKISLRWPIKTVHVVSLDDEPLRVAKEFEESIKYQTNAKEVRAAAALEGMTVEVKPNLGALGKSFGAQSPKIVAVLAKKDSSDIMAGLQKGIIHLDIEGDDIELTKEHVILERSVPKRFADAQFAHGAVYIDTERTPQLEAEGFAREVMRHIQQLRKEEGLKKTDKAIVNITADKESEGWISEWKDRIEEKCGATIKFAKDAKKEVEIRGKKLFFTVK